MSFTYQVVRWLHCRLICMNNNQYGICINTDPWKCILKTDPCPNLIRCPPFVFKKKTKYIDIFNTDKRCFMKIDIRIDKNLFSWNKRIRILDLLSNPWTVIKQYNHFIYTEKEFEFKASLYLLSLLYNTHSLIRLDSIGWITELSRPGFSIKT